MRQGSSTLTAALPAAVACVCAAGKNPLAGARAAVQVNQAGRQNLVKVTNPNSRGSRYSYKVVQGSTSRTQNCCQRGPRQRQAAGGWVSVKTEDGRCGNQVARVARWALEHNEKQRNPHKQCAKAKVTQYATRRFQQETSAVI